MKPLVILASILLARAGCEAAATLYPAPAGISPSQRFSVTVDGTPSFTYFSVGPAATEFTRGHTASWTSFDTAGGCDVRIRRTGEPVHTAVVRPLSSGIKPRVEDGDVVFHLDRPRQLSVECDGDLTNVLFLFANRPEQEIPRRGDPHVVRFEPGIHEIGKFYPLKPGTTYYLAPGAFLKGTFAGGGDGTRVIGRGILSGADFKWPGHFKEASPDRIDLVKLAGNHVEISGVTLVDSPYYVVIANGRDNRFSNVKIIAWYNNTDGISSGPGGLIEDSFVRNADDIFKPFVSGTRINRCVLWADRASVFNLSWCAVEDSGGSKVKDCDIIHHIPFCRNDSHAICGLFGSKHGGSAHIHDILFEDIRIEGASPCLLRMTMERNPWSPKDGKWGRYSHLRFRNIACERPFLYGSILRGQNETNSIEDVIFENLRISGRMTLSADEIPMETNPFVRGLQFR